MRHIAVTVLLASSLGLTLGGCASMSDLAIDPGEWFSGDWFGTKKKLPGDRRAVFPEGVPGVTRGVPPDLMKGHVEQPDVEVPPAAQQAAVEEKAKQKAKSKPKPKVAAKPNPPEDEAKPTQLTVRRSPTAGAQQPDASSQWPEPALAQGQRSAGPQWPEPPAPRSTQTGGGVQWPDPPPAR